MNGIGPTTEIDEMNANLKAGRATRMRRPQDVEASTIDWGVELETKVPRTSLLPIGSYHHGAPVLTARDTTGGVVPAPVFAGRAWMAERDGSIAIGQGEMACEFVSPILHGDCGLAHLSDFVGWLNRIGAKVDASCGCHITIGIESVIHTADPDAVGDFVRKLAHIARWHAKALYGQTGAGRHRNRYSHQLASDVERHARAMAEPGARTLKERAALACGRGMVNFQKAFRTGGNGRFCGCVEFRAFAGTTSIRKIQHHLASALGLCRRASQVQALGAFRRNKLQESRTRTAEEALAFLWHYLGWTNAARPTALGLFGSLHSSWPLHSAEALRLCRKWDQKFPGEDV